VAARRWLLHCRDGCDRFGSGGFRPMTRQPHRSWMVSVAGLLAVACAPASAGAARISVGGWISQAVLLAIALFLSWLLSRVWNHRRRQEKSLMAEIREREER